MKPTHRNITLTKMSWLVGTTFLFLVAKLHAITGSWHFTGARFEGSNAGTPQITRTTGTAVISQSGENYTVTFQFPGASASVTVPLTAVGSDYRAEVQVDSPPYDITRSVVIRDHGDDTLTINWVDAGYEQESPYGGFPDMQKFSAISGALTKAAAPVADPDAWEGLWNYDGHLFEADDSGEGLHEDFIEELDIVRDGPTMFSVTDLTENDTISMNLADGELRWGDTYPGGGVNYEDDLFLVEETGEMEDLSSILLGNGRAVLIWFGQGTHQLTIKESTSGPGSGPYPSLQYAYAEVGLMTLPAGPPGPDTPPADGVTDTDSDGVTDLLEYAFNLNPAVSDRHTLTEGSGSSGLPAMRLDTTTTPARLRIEYVRRKAPSAAGIDYQVQWSSNLSSWTTDAGTATVTSIDEIWERVVVTDPSPSTKRFGRVAVLLIEPLASPPSNSN